MNINKLSKVYCNIQNYSVNNRASKQNNSVSFQKAPVSLKNAKTAFVGAAMALAALGGTVANAQTLQNDNVNTEIVTSQPNNLLPQDDCMAEYFTEHGFTKEQRQEIADSAENYANKYFKTLQQCYIQNYENCSYFGPMIADFPANPLRLNLGYHMGKAEKYAKDLTEFRNNMILNGVIRNGHYIENPELNPYTDTQEEINKILGEGVTFKEYLENNAETVVKLDSEDTSPEDLVNLTDEEMAVRDNIFKCLSVGAKYINAKCAEYQAEADSCMESKTNDYISDMNKLNVFRNEENEKENMFFQFDYWATSEGFNHGVNKVYKDILEQQIATDVEEVKAKTDRKGQIFDLSGKLVSEPLKPGIYVKEGKKIAVK